MAKTLELLVSNLDKILQQKGWNRSQLAEEMGIQRQQLSQWLNGGKTPSIEVFDRLSKVLDVEPMKLLAGSVDASISPLEAWEIVGRAIRGETAKRSPMSALVKTKPVTIEGGLSENRRWLMNLAENGSDVEIDVAVRALRNSIEKRRGKNSDGGSSRGGQSA